MTDEQLLVEAAHRITVDMLNSLNVKKNYGTRAIYEWLRNAPKDIWKHPDWLEEPERKPPGIGLC